MPISTDLNTAKYNDDYDASKDYYRILFQSGVSVQTRELNQLQDLFQAQIERFGDNIFATGTIVSGCNLLPMSTFPYIKINDLTVDGGIASPSSFVYNKVMNETTGLVASIVSYTDGYQSTDPNLKTLYINYNNTGFNANVTAFSAGDILTVFSGTVVGIERVNVSDGATGFSNTDQVVAIPAVAVTVSSGTFSNTEYVTNGSGANLQIIAIDSSTLANSNQIILSLKPRNTDLANASITSTAYTLSLNDSIVGLTSNAHATISQVIGNGFEADAVTDPNGTIVNIDVTQKGFGYNTLPYVTLVSKNNSAGLSSLSLIPQNWITEITVASTANAVGNGYAFAVGEGVIYQKGYFLRVLPQLVIVDKYSTSPDGVVVGFDTIESVVTSNIDTSLNDPAAGKNNGAPGADRLRLTPQLVTIPTTNASSNATFLSLAEWSAGSIYYTRQQTSYSAIGDKIAEGISDTSGNFFIDPFLITSQSPIANDTPASFDIVMDPGSAYIEGYKVQTQSNFRLNYPSSFLSLQQNNYSVNLNYNSYVQINNVGGAFRFNIGDTVTLYDTAKGFSSNSTLVQTQNTSPVGSVLGTMRMRSLELATINSTNPIYNLYVFDILMANGKNFSDVRSISYANTVNGIADIVTTTNATTLKQQATIINPQQSGLVFPLTKTALKNVANTTYPFRSIDTALTVNTSGFITKSVTANSSWVYPYTGALTASQMTDLFIVPTSVDLVFVANTSGTVSVNTATANVIGTSTNFLSEYAVGDWMYVYGTSTYNLKQVQRIVNNTFMVVDSNVAFSNTSSNITRCFPKNIPIPMGYRSGLTANVDTSQTTLTINLGGALTASVPEPVAMTYNVNQVNITQGVKTPVRSQFVKMNLGTHPQSKTGPWCLGVPDVFRLRGVWIGDSSVDSTGSNYFQQFYIDNNQNLDYYGLSWLMIRPNASVSLSTSNYILVEFDYFTSSGPHFYSPVSYLGSNTDHIVSVDTLTLSQLAINSGTLNTWEVPSFFTDAGTEVDLLRCIDFRAAVANTCAPNANSALAPVNPSSVETFGTNEKFFPVPGAALTTNIQSWLSNFVSVFIDRFATVSTANATITSSKITSATTPPGTMKIADILIPAYPALPQNRSVRLTEIMNTGVMNIQYAASRPLQHAIIPTSTITQNQTKVYSQSDIATLDRRLQNVEYYVSLNQSEAALSNMVIPSNNDPTQNRYKFGFLSLNFQNQSLLDISNPQWAATNKNGLMLPSRLDWEVYFGDDFSGTMPYILEPIVEQTNATIGSVDDPTATPQCAISVANTVAYKLLFRNVGDSAGYYAPQNGAIDVVNLTLADQTHLANAETFGISSHQDYWSVNPTDSTVELFFYAYDNAVKIEIFQGSTLIVDTSSAVNLTAVDISNLTGSSSNQWFNDNTSQFMKNFVNVGSGFVMYAGKIQWNYNGTGGQNITVRTTNGNGVKNWRWVMSYPINGSSAGCAPPAPSNVIDIYGCGNGFYYAFADALMEAINLNGGTTAGLSGVIEYGIQYATKATGSVDLASYLANPLDSQLTIDAMRVFREGAALGSYADNGVAYGQDGGGGYYEVLGTWHRNNGGTFDIINNQAVEVWYYYNPQTDTLVESTQASALSGVVRSQANWSQIVSAPGATSIASYTGTPDTGNHYSNTGYGGGSGWTVTKQ